MKAIAYIRVSTDDQSNSLEVQAQKISDYCTFKGIDLVEIIHDEDVSGFKPFLKRPGGKRASEALTGDIQTIIALKPDRLFRNTKDALITVDGWNRDNIDLHMVDMGGASFSTKTAIGRLMFTTLISFAEFERNIAGERTKSVLDKKKSDNKIYSSPVFGFDHIGGKMVVNEKEMEVVKKIYSLREEGISMDNIASIVNELGCQTKNGKLFQKGQIFKILNNEIYKSIH